jgi:hypothetical protein
MPLIAMRRHLKRFEREQPSGADRSMQVRPFGERRVEVGVGRELETGAARHHERFRLH